MRIKSITIAICTYNNSISLIKTLDTIIAQCVEDYIHWKVLIIDNNSTDETNKLVLAFIKQHKVTNFFYLFEEQQGLAYARRRAIRESSSELIVFVDDDCLLLPNWINEAVDFYYQYPNVGAVGGLVKLQWEIEPSEILLKCQSSLSAQDYGNSPVKLPATGFTYLVGAGLLLKRQAIIDSGWLDSLQLSDRKGQELISGGDVEMILLIRQAGYDLWYNPSMILYHYIPERRISLNYLSRLHRAFGKTDHVLQLLALNHQSSIFWWLFALSSSIINFGRQLLGLLVWNIFSFKSIEPMRILLIQRALGNIEGCSSYLFKSITGH